MDLIRQSGQDFEVVCVFGKQTMYEMLSEICQTHTIKEMYVAGGDGTFRDVMNWLIKQGMYKDCKLTYLGGGEFCYMRKFFHLPSADPLKNLLQIFFGTLNSQHIFWRPVQVTDLATQHVQYCSVFANGVIYDIIRWYEEKGKGSVFKVLLIILSSIFCVLFERIRQWHGRLFSVRANIEMDGRKIPPQEYLSIVIAAVPEFMMWCRPFQKNAWFFQTFNLMYWGSFVKLACSIPWVYFGKCPYWLQGVYFNDVIRKTIIHTSDARVSMDGDTIDWPEHNRNGH